MKTFIIRLKDNELSCSFANEAMKSAIDMNIDAEYFEAITKDQATVFFKKHQIVINPNQLFAHWSLGTMGCFASHWSLWNMCAESDEPFLILEHDGVILRNPTEIVDLIEDVCHLDYHLPFFSVYPETSQVHFQLYDYQVKNEYSPGVTDYPTNDFYNESDVTGTCFRGLYGYIMTPQGARKLLDFCKKHGAFPADRMVCANAVKLQKSKCTYVRLNPYFKSMKIQRESSTR